MDSNYARGREAELGFDLFGQPSVAPGVPGKSSLTSRLMPAPVFRVSDPETARALGEAMAGSRGRIQRAARDDNGVAAGAEALVDRAASSSGQSPPTHVQRQFEASTGADLSSVRVHTGGASATAAHAVGAKAYTVGQDIHFAAGRYQPDDPFGLHLLAHEVAHTVQQGGSAASARQHKLEVSSPQDSLEHEADRAADAMVRGEAVAVSGGGAGSTARSSCGCEQAACTCDKAPATTTPGRNRVLHRSALDAFEDWATPGALDQEATGDGSETPSSGPETPSPDAASGQPPSWYQHQSNANERGALKATIYFATDNAATTPDDLAAIDEVLARYGQQIEAGMYEIEIVGFADERADDDYNIALANRRADTVCEQLEARLGSGLPADTWCHAEGELPSSNLPDELARNRRVEILLRKRTMPTQPPAPPAPPAPEPEPEVPHDKCGEERQYCENHAQAMYKLQVKEVCSKKAGGLFDGEEGESWFNLGCQIQAEVARDRQMQQCAAAAATCNGQSAP